MAEKPLKTTRFIKMGVVPMICFLQTLSAADESVISYNFVGRTMVLFEGRESDGVEWIPFYPKRKDGKSFDPVEAKMRLRSKDGQELPLVCEAFSTLPPEGLTEADKAMAAKGFTHRVWIPKNHKKFLDGGIVHNLGKGSMEMNH